MSPASQAKELERHIRDIPDFPKKGIVFKDITPLLKDKDAFRAAVDLIAERYAGKGLTAAAGIESRGFLFAAAVAYKLGIGVIPVRKKGKLPYKTLSASYDLEYGSDSVEVHEDAAKKGDKVLLIDDLIATGGTAGAACELLEKLGAEVIGPCFLIELGFLEGRKKLPGRDIFSVLSY